MHGESAPLQIVNLENESAIQADQALHAEAQPAQPPRESFESYRQALRGGVPSAYSGYGNANTFPTTETRKRRMARKFTEFRLARREVLDATVQQFAEMGISIRGGIVRHQPYGGPSRDQESDYQAGR